MLKRLRTTFILCFFALTKPLYAAANAWQMDMPKGVTPLSRDIYDLHMIAIYICAGIS